MTLMKRSDLRYTDYSWTAIGDDDPRITGKPDSTMFSRHEGYEVLALINRFAKKHSLKKIETGHKIENMLHNRLPSDVRSQANVTKWLEDNWTKH